MKKRFKTALIIILLPFVFFVLWINVTVGSFHKPSGCCGPICGIRYGIEVQLQCRADIICPEVSNACPPETVINKLQLLLSNLDFNK